MFQLFGKSPKYKKFAYSPRFYDPQEEERRERELRIRKEMEEREKAEEPVTKPGNEEEFAYRQRIQGSFRTAKKTVKVQADPSANMLRLVILLIISVGLIAYITYGQVAIYGVFFTIVPLYFYLKFRSVSRKTKD